MTWRRGGHPVFAPAALLWLPALAGGLMLLGLRFFTRDVGSAVWVVRVSMGHPFVWFQNPVTGTFGVLLLVLASSLWVVSQMRPNPGEWPALWIRYTPFGAAALLMFLASALAAFHLDGHVLDGDGTGITWRFVATYRTSPTDIITSWACAGVGVIAWVLSFGRIDWRRVAALRAPVFSAAPANARDD